MYNGVTPALLHQLLEVAEVEGRRYDVLHFIGHGEFEPNTGFGYLIFEDATGRAHELRADQFRQMVTRRGVRLIFLNACETRFGTIDGREPDVAQGVAPMLVGGGVQAVVANQFKVLDQSATEFARHFYWSLAVGRRLGDAAREARIAVNYSVTGESIDWAVPVLFARNPADRLRAEAARFSSSIHANATWDESLAGRRRGSSTQQVVGVWDVDYVIPTLARILRQLNEIEDVFAFEKRRASLPGGTRPLGSGRKGAYVDAQGLQRRLTRLVQKYGSSHISCVVHHPLRDGREVRLISTVGDGGQASIVSTAGFLDLLDGERYTIERLLTNALVFNLSGCNSHERGPKDCRCYYNNELDIRWIAGPLKFCAACLKKVASDRRGALIALLQAFSNDS